MVSNAVADEIGHFVIEGLERETYTIVATPWNPWGGEEGPSPLPFSSRTVDAAQHAEVKLDLQQTR